MTHSEGLARAVRNVPDYPQPGVQFKDITPILADPRLLNIAIEALAEPFLDAGITKILAIEARGFILGAALAHRLRAGFVPVRKHGKLPFSTYKEEYSLEYGTDRVEMHTDALVTEDRVLIHDDVIATGGTALAAYRLATRVGADVKGFSFLIELGFLGGRMRLKEELLEQLEVHSVIAY